MTDFEQNQDLPEHERVVFDDDIVEFADLLFTVNDISDNDVLGSEQECGRLLCLIADDRPSDLTQIIREIPDNLFSEMVLIDRNCTDEVRAQAQRLGLNVVEASSTAERGAVLKLCFNLARVSGVSAMTAFDIGQPRDLEALGSVVRLLDQEAWDLIIGARVTRLTDKRPAGMSRIDFYSSRLRGFLSPLFLGRQFQDSASDFISCSSHVIWAVNYAQMSDGDVFDWQFLNHVLASSFRVGEVPIPVTRFQSRKRLSWWQNACSMLHTMAVAVDHQFGRWIGKDRIIFKTRRKLVPVEVFSPDR